MHPILGKARPFFLYLLYWTMLSAVPPVLFVRANGMRVMDALAVVVPLAFIYSFFCLFAWYPCRFTPLKFAGYPRLVVTNLVAAAAMSYLWVLIAQGLIALLAQLPAYRGLNQKLVSYMVLANTCVLLYLMAAGLFYVLLALEASREAEKREAEARVLARDAELRALKAQVNPHFLFNSLNSISALTTVDAARAREMCVTLADFLRRTLGLGEKSVVPLEEELALVRRFLAVEKIRFGARLQMQESIAPDALSCLVPPLLLQPLVENAVWHGIANLPEGGCVQMKATCGDSSLSIVIENSFDPDSEPMRRNGLGLQNVRQRLEARYGGDAQLTAHPDGSCFRVAVQLPAERKPA